MRKIPYTTCSRCHTTRPHRAKGLCYSCYGIVRSQSGQGVLQECRKCHKIKPHGAKGMCRTCYKVEWQKTRLREFGIPSSSPEHKHEYGQRYYAKNRERLIQKQKERYYKNHKAVLELERGRRKEPARKAKAIEYRRTHKERANELKRQQRAEHPEIHKRYKQVRRARQRNLPHTLTPQEWLGILKEYENACAYCGKSDIAFHQEHKIPVAHGGGYVKDNIVPACETCNQRKHTKTDAEFREYLKQHPSP